MPEIAAPGLRAADGTRLAVPCQQYATNRASGTRWADQYALLPALPALVDAALADQVENPAALLALDVGTDTGETYVVEVVQHCGGWLVAVDGRVVDGTTWASVQAATVAAVATVLDLWDVA